jgi:hypothetical protein
VSISACAAGYYLQSGACQACPAGTYNGAVGATVCTNCPVGKLSAATAATSEASCSLAAPTAGPTVSLSPTTRSPSVAPTVSLNPTTRSPSAAPTASFTSQADSNNYINVISNQGDALLLEFDVSLSQMSYCANVSVLGSPASSLVSIRFHTSLTNWPSDLIVYFEGTNQFIGGNAGRCVYWPSASHIGTWPYTHSFDGPHPGCINYDLDLRVQSGFTGICIGNSFHCYNDQPRWTGQLLISGFSSAIPPAPSTNPLCDVSMPTAGPTSSPSSLSAAGASALLTRPPNSVLLQAFNYTGSVQVFNAMAYGLFVSACGAVGGGEEITGSGSIVGAGGSGGCIYGWLVVRAPTTWYVYVGSDAGYNGGGHGTSDSYEYSGSGGGASDIRLSPSDLSTRFIVGGGGGGLASCG